MGKCQLREAFTGNMGLIRFQVLNLLSRDRAYKFSCEPKLKDISAKPGMTDLRYIFVYALQKTVIVEDKQQPATVNGDMVH